MREELRVKGYNGGVIQPGLGLRHSVESTCACEKRLPRYPGPAQNLTWEEGTWRFRRRSDIPESGESESSKRLQKPIGRERFLLRICWKSQGSSSTGLDAAARGWNRADSQQRFLALRPDSRYRRPGRRGPDRDTAGRGEGRSRHVLRHGAWFRVEDLPAMEMTKWFNTNYHYIVPEFWSGNDISPFKPRSHWKSSRRPRALGYQTKPVLLGPVTFLLLGKVREDSFNPWTCSTSCCRSTSRC